jgi:hypothetical protein
VGWSWRLTVLEGVGEAVGGGFEVCFAVGGEAVGVLSVGDTPLGDQPLVGQLIEILVDAGVGDVGVVGVQFGFDRQSVWSIECCKRPKEITFEAGERAPDGWIDTVAL